jgi:hypothetical protein
MTIDEEIAKLKADAATLKKQLDSLHANASNLHRSASGMLLVCQKLTASLAELQKGVDLLVDPKRQSN